MIEYQAGAPMERVHLDFLGSLPKTKYGNEYVLMMVDQFTKWVKCIPLPTQTAEVTARAAVNHFSQGLDSHFKFFLIKAEILILSYSQNFARPFISIRLGQLVTDLHQTAKQYFGGTWRRVLAVCTDYMQKDWSHNVIGVRPRDLHLLPLKELRHKLRDWTPDQLTGNPVAVKLCDWITFNV